MPAERVPHRRGADPPGARRELHRRVGHLAGSRLAAGQDDDLVHQLETFGAVRDQQHGARPRRVENVVHQRRPSPGRGARSTRRGASTGASARRARASTRRWRWPPGRAACPPRRRACRAPRERGDPSVRRARSSAVHQLASRLRPRQPEVLADRRVEDVRVLAGERERAADVLLARTRARRGRRSSRDRSPGRGSVAAGS